MENNNDTPECTNCGGKGYNTVMEGLRGSADLGVPGFERNPRVQKKPCRYCQLGAEKNEKQQLDLVNILFDVLRLNDDAKQEVERLVTSVEQRAYRIAIYEAIDVVERESITDEGMHVNTWSRIHHALNKLIITNSEFNGLFDFAESEDDD